MSTALIETFPRENLVRALSRPIELRARSVDSSIGMPVMHIEFAVFDQWAEIDSWHEGNYMERILHGAFDRTIKQHRDQIKCLHEHGRDPHIGKKVLGTIESISEENDVAAADVALFDTSYNRDLLPGIEAGVYGASFLFNVVRDRVVSHPPLSDHNPKGLRERSVLEVTLFEFGTCTFGVYQGATAGLRSITDEMLLSRDPELLTRAMERTGISLNGLSIPIRDASEIKGSRKYERAISAVAGTAWDITEDALDTIATILQERREGVRLSRDEIDARIGAVAQREESPKASSSIAVIPIYGSLVPKADAFDDVSSATSYESIGAMFRAAMADDSVKAVVLELDTPGGAATLVPELASEIRAARGTKPIIASANPMAASAGYFIASAADEIVATDSGEVGSIGTIAIHRDMSQAYVKQGINHTLITAGKYKAESSPYGPLTEESTAELQRMVDSHYEIFIDAVAMGRGVSTEKVLSDFGQGRMLMAKDALEAGMIDRVETFDQTLARLEQQYGAPAEMIEEDQQDQPAEAISSEEVESDDQAQEGADSKEASAEDGVADTQNEPHPAEAHRVADAPGVNDNQKKEEMVKTIEEMRARQSEILARQQEIDAEFQGMTLTDEARSEWDDLKEENRTLEMTITDMQSRERDLLEHGKRGSVNENGGKPEPESRDRTSSGGHDRGSRIPENIYDLGEYRSRTSSPEDQANLLQDGARRALEIASYPHERADKNEVVVHVERMLEHAVERNPGDLARHILTTGAPGYRKAWEKAMVGRGLTSEEMRALSAFTGADGGVLVPFILDPTIIPTSDGAVNPYRRIARQISLVGSNTWKGVSSAGVTAAYEAELTEVADDTPDFEQPELTVEKAHSWIEFSIEAGDDISNLAGEMAVLFQDAKDELEADQFTDGVGHGSKVPEGILTGATEITITAGTSAFVDDDLYKIEGDLPPRFLSRAQWVAHRYIYSKVRQFDTSGGAGLWMTIGQGLPSNQAGNTGAALLGYPANECSEMPATLTTPAKIAVLGDWRHFAVVDRVGLSTELVPHIMGQNNRPVGKRGLYAYWRNTSGVLVANAFRVLVTKS